MAKHASLNQNSGRKRPTRRSGWGLRTLQRIHRRDLILLLGLLALACVSVLAVAFLILRLQTVAETTVAVATPASVPGPQPTHTVTFAQITGLNQYALAKPVAQSWAADAQLLAANATWPKVIGKNNVGEPTTWTYRFYSPATQRMLFVNVSDAGQVEKIEHVAPVTLPPRLVATDNWVIDSNAALALWLDYGGAKVLGQNPGLEMLMQLRTLPNNPNPVWMVVGLNNQTENIHTVVVDAVLGVVTLVQPENFQP